MEMGIGKSKEHRLEGNGWGTVKKKDSITIGVSLGRLGLLGPAVE